MCFSLKTNFLVRTLIFSRIFSRLVWVPSCPCGLAVIFTLSFLEGHQKVLSNFKVQKYVSHYSFITGFAPQHLKAMQILL